MVNRDKVEYRDSTPFNQDKLQDLQTIKDAILHKITGKDVRAPIAQIPDALIKAIQDADDLGQLGALLEIIEARGGFETLGLYEQAQDRAAELTKQAANKAVEASQNTASEISGKASIQYVDSKVSSLMSGSPKGAFDTLADLKAKYPTGNAGIYVTRDNGHWYYYDSGWQDGGVWQGKEVSDADKQRVYSYITDQQNLIKNGKALDGLTSNYFAIGAVGTLSVNEELGHKWIRLTSPDDKVSKGISTAGRVAGQLGSDLHFSGLVRLKSVAKAKAPVLIVSAHYIDKQGNTLNSYELCEVKPDYDTTTKIELNVPSPLSLGMPSTDSISILVYDWQANPIDLEITDYELKELPTALKPINLEQNLFMYDSASKAWNINNSNGSAKNVVIDQDVWTEIADSGNQSSHGAIAECDVNGYMGTLGIKGSFYLYDNNRTNYTLKVRYIQNDGSIYAEGVVAQFNSFIDQYRKVEFDFKPDSQLLNASYVAKIRLILVNTISENNMAFRLSKPEVYQFVDGEEISFDIGPDTLIGANTAGNVEGRVSIDNRAYHVERFGSEDRNYKGISGKVNLLNFGLQNVPVKFSFLAVNLGDPADNNFRVGYNLYSGNGKSNIGYVAGDYELNSTPKRIEFTMPAISSFGVDVAKLKTNVNGGELLLFDNFNNFATTIGIADLHITPNYYNETGNITENLPVISLTGDFASMTKDNSVLMGFDYRNGQQHITGYTDSKWQGDSSVNFPAKNIRLKLYKDKDKKNKLKFKARPDMPATNKFNSKINYVQPYQARNLINAKLIAEVTSTREDLPDGLVKSPLYGEIQGVPAVCYINGLYYGLMSLNTAKDDVVFGMTDETTQFVLEGEDHTDAANFKADTFELDKDFSLEYPDNLTDQARKTMEDGLKFINHSDSLSKEDFHKQMPMYFDVPSVIDYMIMMDLIQAEDETDKNICWACYDGKHLTAVMYDVDSTWGLSAIPQGAVGDYSILSEQLRKGKGNKLFAVMIKYYGAEIKARWNELESLGIITVPYIQNKFSDYINNQIGIGNLEKHWSKWPESAPVDGKTDFGQLMRTIQARIKLLDEFFNSLS